MRREYNVNQPTIQLRGPSSAPIKPSDLTSKVLWNIQNRSIQENQREKIRYSTQWHDLGDKRNQLYNKKQENVL